MATVKVKFRASSIHGKEGVIYYQVIHNRIIRQIKTEYMVYSDEWDSNTAEFILPEFNEVRKRQLGVIRVNMRWDLERLSRIIEEYNYCCPIKFFEFKNTGLTSSIWKSALLVLNLAR